jgi:hypothetical protein
MALSVGPCVSKWLDQAAERNRRSLVRLTKALPAIFPPFVLSRALNQSFILPTPRLAIDSYWRAHPLRADRLARALAAHSGAPNGWKWQFGSNRNTGLPITFRAPPAPYRERAYSGGKRRAPVVCRRMSALGQERTLRPLSSMSAITPKADIRTDDQDVCFVPQADICSAAKERPCRSLYCAGVYLRSTKIWWQSSGPMFSGVRGDDGHRKCGTGFAIRSASLLHANCGDSCVKTTMAIGS